MKSMDIGYSLSSIINYILNCTNCGLVVNHLHGKKDKAANVCRLNRFIERIKKNENKTIDKFWFRAPGRRQQLAKS